MSETTRRGVLAGAAGVAAATALAACGDNSKPADNPGTTGGETTGAAPTTGGATGGPTAGSGALAQKSDIPVGGGKVFGNKDTVITQPAAGTFKGFSATCTHMGCTVATVQAGTIDCPCHGSKYSAADGTVKTGPATKALTPKQLKIDGESISLA